MADDGVGDGGNAEGGEKADGGAVGRGPIEKRVLRRLSALGRALKVEEAALCAASPKNVRWLGFVRRRPCPRKVEEGGATRLRAARSRSDVQAERDGEDVRRIVILELLGARVHPARVPGERSDVRFLVVVLGAKVLPPERRRRPRSLRRGRTRPLTQRRREMTRQVELDRKSVV